MRATPGPASRVRWEHVEGAQGHSEGRCARARGCTGLVDEHVGDCRARIGRQIAKQLKQSPTPVQCVFRHGRQRRRRRCRRRRRRAVIARALQERSGDIVGETPEGPAHQPRRHLQRREGERKP